MLAAFIGGWEILLILFVLGTMVAVPLVILGIVFLVRQQKKSAPPISTERQMRQ